MRERTVVGRSQVRTAYLASLQTAWEEGHLVLFLGSGVSVPYGIPSWKDLVRDLLFEVGDPKFKRFSPAYRPVLAAWLAEQFDFSPALMARVIRYRLAKESEGAGQTQEQFTGALRDRLYRNLVNADSSAALPAVADLVAASEQAGRRVRAIVTFNFDDLLERELERRGVPVLPVVRDGPRPRAKFPIIHAHGYLPKDGAGQESPLVFTEDQYHMLTTTPFHWATTEILTYLRNSTVLFVGLSMSDPNLRRLVDAAQMPSSRPVHFVVRRDHRLSPSELSSAGREIQTRYHQSTPSEDPAKTDSELETAVTTMLRRAHTYDRELFKDMGVGVLWLRDYDDIPDLLRAISGRFLNLGPAREDTTTMAYRDPP